MKTSKELRILHAHAEVLKDLEQAERLGFEPTIAAINARNGEPMDDTVRTFEDLRELGRIEPQSEPVTVDTPWLPK